MPFDFKQIQFQIRVSFAMTINKSQGQSLSISGLKLENPCSRVGKPSALFVLAPNKK